MSKNLMTLILAMVLVMVSHVGVTLASGVQKKLRKLRSGINISIKKQVKTITFGKGKGKSFFIGHLNEKGLPMSGEFWTRSGVLLSAIRYVPGVGKTTLTDRDGDGFLEYREFIGASKNADMAVVKVSIMSSKSGLERVVINKEIPGVQFVTTDFRNCSNFGLNEPQAMDLSASVGRIFSRNEDTIDCQKGTDNLIFSGARSNFDRLSPDPGADGIFQKDFKGVGGFCVDKSCHDDPKRIRNFKELLESTVAEGASCMANLGSSMMGSGDSSYTKSLMERGNLDQISRGDKRHLKSSFALKNSAELLLLADSSSNFGDLFSAESQVGFIGAEGTREGTGVSEVYDLAGSDAESLASLRQGVNPLKIICYDYQRLYVQDVGKPYRSADMPDDEEVDIYPSQSYSLTGQKKACAALPGLPGWPMIRFHKNRTTPNETNKALLFHEMLHNLGYRHNMGIPVHTACQVCCFPMGNLGQDSDSPSKRRNIGCEQARELSCQMCAGGYKDKSGNWVDATTWEATETQGFIDAKKEYESYVKKCYNNKNAQ